MLSEIKILSITELVFLFGVNWIHEGFEFKAICKVMYLKRKEKKRN